MKKEIKIEGMTCSHCSSSVDKALNSIDGVKAKVNLKKNNAIVEIDSNVNEDALRNAVTEAGYEVVSISEKKGFFS